jgi:hypothetical protein
MAFGLRRVVMGSACGVAVAAFWVEDCNEAGVIESGVECV